MLKLVVSDVDIGKRIDVFISEKTEISRNNAINLIEDGNITVNSKSQKKNYKVKEGDNIEVNMPEAKPLDLTPYEIEMDIRYEDSDVIVINKPKGLVVHPAPGNEEKTLVHALLAHCKGELSGIGGVQRPGIVHRIDKNTSSPYLELNP